MYCCSSGCSATSGPPARPPACLTSVFHLFHPLGASSGGQCNRLSLLLVFPTTAQDCFLTNTDPLCPPPKKKLNKRQVEGSPHADLAFQPAAQYAPLMDRVYAELAAGVADIAGSSVEHNKFCVSTHFRNCAPDDYPAGTGGARHIPACAWER